VERLAQLTSALAGRYEIDRELGHGGMATVYLARDLRHHRKVALKVLDAEIAAALGGDRFLAEIKTTANLQHPHVVPLHDSGESDGVLYYVMPFVEGESLRDRLTRERQLPVDDAVRIAREVADALQYAHEQGVVHRDIKPENILLQGGHAMVADFGIALAVQHAGTARMTQTGLSLGTPQYMAPEQAMGERQIDARADVYALAAVTYEMLVGEPPFTGPTMQAIVARLLADEPRPMTPQRKSIPAHVEAAVHKGLEKLPADRFASARDLSAALSGEGQPPRIAVHPRRTWWRETAIAASVVAVALAALLLSRRFASSDLLPLMTSTITAPADAPSDLRNVALSPDGRGLAFVSSTAADGGRIWIRRMGDGTAKPLAETRGAQMPFWSRDGSEIGFFAAGSLRVVSLSTGAVRALAPAPNPSAPGAWAANGTIVYDPFFSGLWTVASNGGTPKPFGESQKDDRWPSFLPDGRRFLFWRPARDSHKAAALLGDVETGAVRTVAEDITHPVYVAPGTLLFFQATDKVALGQPAILFAQPFELKHLTLTGEPVALSPRVDRPGERPVFSATPDFLVVREAPATPNASMKSSVFWLDRATGRTTPVTAAGLNFTFRISHDGRRVAFGGDGLWLGDPERDVAVRVPTKVPAPWPPVWSPDDRAVATVDGSDIADIPVDGRSAERVRKANDDPAWADPTDWALDNSAIFYIREPSATRPQWELWRYVLASSRVEHVPTGPGNVLAASVAPDSKWIAWESDATGRREIYLAPIAGSTTPVRVSKDGGGSPRWRADGRELFFMGGDGRITSVSIDLKASPTVGEPRAVSPRVVNAEPFLNDPFSETRFDVTPKGDRFLVQTPPDPGAYNLTLIQGWQSRVRKP
jgi:serine/threonine-protein kinase